MMTNLETDLKRL